LASFVLERPQPTPVRPQHRCIDVGDDNPTGRATAAAKGYQPHLRRIGTEKRDRMTGKPRFPARRWVVERTLAWRSKCRALLMRYDKQSASVLGLLQLACALLWFRRLHRLRLVR
jgi:putative transposase